MEFSRVRTRFAPSPTGYLHVGGARTALFNWLYAKHNDGKFILRIEDTDHERNTDESCQEILNGLKWLGLDWDEGPGKETGKGPFYQSQRQSIYEEHLKKLENSDLVYEDNGAIRFKVPSSDIEFHDEICGPQTINLKTTGNRSWDKEKGIEIESNPDFIIRRPDGTFLFHFVNVIDDIEMNISHILRGEDHLSNSPKHVALFNALGCPSPIFAHIPLILNADGSKMSKRDDGAGIEWYKNQGFLPEAVTNYIALLGWSPKDDREKLNIGQIIELFDFEHLNKSNSRFDLDKCKWLNGQYINDLTNKEYLEKAAPFSSDASEEIISLTQPRVQQLSEIERILEPILNDNYPTDRDASLKISQDPEIGVMIKELNHTLESLDPWTAENIKSAIKDYAEDKQIKIGSLMFPLRVCSTGVGQGTDLMPTLEAIGRNTTIARIKNRIEQICADI
ncbi:MAG: glutamate--tRNA ligase family protein [Verrucomicrobiota bacterium]|nr:glutamate--tRNA ligase family protein [Verrucomicrobiota bacterium]